MSENQNKRQDARREARSRRIGFVRFYSRRLLDGLGRGWSLARRMGKTHSRRSMMQRMASAVVVVGVAAGVVVTVGWNPFLNWAANQEILRSQEMLQTDDGRLAETQAAEESGRQTAGQMAMEPPQAVEAPVTPRPIPSVQERPTELTPQESAPQGETVRQSVAIEPLEPIPTIPVASVDHMVWPVQGSVERSFGWYRHPLFEDWRYSSQVRLEPAEDPVQAALAGRVRDVVNENGIWRISIEHAGGWTTVYEGLGDVYVDSFQVVKTGEEIGRAAGISPVGGVGFSLLQNGVAVDPKEVIQSGLVPAQTRP